MAAFLEEAAGSCETSVTFLCVLATCGLVFVVQLRCPRRDRGLAVTSPRGSRLQFAGDSWHRPCVRMHPHLCCCVSEASKVP